MKRALFAAGLRLHVLERVVNAVLDVDLADVRASCVLSSSPN